MINFWSFFDRTRVFAKNFVFQVAVCCIRAVGNLQEIRTLYMRYNGVVILISIY